MNETKGYPMTERRLRPVPPAWSLVFVVASGALAACSSSGSNGNSPARGDAGDAAAPVVRSDSGASGSDAGRADSTTSEQGDSGPGSGSDSGPTKDDSATSGGMDSATETDSATSSEMDSATETDSATGGGMDSATGTDGATGSGMDSATGDSEVGGGRDSATGSDTGTSEVGDSATATDSGRMDSGVATDSSVSPAPDGGSSTFTALHTYYISPTGNDGNSGTSPSSAWLSPKHAVDCGDVIIAAPGTYDSANFGNTGNWGKVASCPSTTGGIDGTGGIYFANLLCGGPDIESCVVVGNGNTSLTFWVDQSNWAVTGFKSTNPTNNWGSCFAAEPSGMYSIHHVAFVNDWAEGCPGDGIGGGSFYGGSGYSIDYLATVGVIAHGNAGGTSECYSGLSISVPINYDNDPGTHIFVAGVFSYDNIDGTCGYNAGAPGGYTTATATVSSGTQIQVNDPSGSGWKVGMPIADLGSQVLPIAAIAPGTVITAISGNAVTLSKSLAGTVTSGDSVQAALTTDGEGIILDTWNLNPYTGQTVIEQSMVWHNGNGGIEVNQATNASFHTYVFGNTSYGNLQDPYHYGYGGLDAADFVVNGWSSPLSITKNIFEESLATMGGAPNNSTLWTGDDVYAAIVGETGSVTSVEGNFFKGLQTSCVGGGTCDTGHDVEAFNGYTFGANTYASAGFANPSAVPTAAPKCTGYATTTECMVATGVVADLAPSGAAVGVGYEPPQACQPDPYFPTWLKGAVGLAVSGSKLSYGGGLITKPCGM